MSFDPTKPHLSIIIPAFNEEKRITKSLKRVEEFVQQQTYSVEILVVDDGSRDRTGSLVREFMAGKNGFQLIPMDQNQGKGAAVKKGMLSATGRFRLFADADFSSEIDDLEELFRWVGSSRDDGLRYDVVIGSRRVPGARLLKRQPPHRELSGRIFSLFVRLFLFPGFLDTQCGFKLFTAEAVAQIFPKQTILGFGFDVEILFIALKKCGFRVKEAPLRWVDSPNSQVRLFRDSLRMFMDLFRVRLNDWMGRYQ